MERLRERWDPILKDVAALSPRPNLVDYDAARASFSWERAAAALDGLPGGGLNLAHEAVVRHAAGPRADKVAIRWIGRSGRRDLTYRDLDALSSRFAHVLAKLGVEAGERVFALCPRLPELYAAALGTLKHRAVFCPLFSAFGPEPVRQRVEIGEGRALVTTPALYAKKVAPIRDALPSLRHVLLIGDGGPIPADQLPDGCVDLWTLLADAPDDYRIGRTDPEALALLHFTSGTTGKPKGAMHVHGAALHHWWSAFYALDLHPDDVFWCTADPGWVTGTSYGILAPLLHGVTLVVDEQDFDAARWIALLRDEGVTVWYTAPTAVRMMMRAGVTARDLPALRFVASVGEPLGPEAVVWGEQAFGLPIHDNWWQSETGGIAIANLAGLPIRPGSMGRPLPGIEAAIVRRTDAGVEVLGPDEAGELALRAGWPSMFRGYLHEDARYAKCFVDGWYLSGDRATRDADGYFWFVGRMDDVIKTAGHLIGPFEVEAVLTEHPSVAEAAVIGVPDPVAMEVIKAFVVLKPGIVADEAVRRELLALARRRLGPAVAPRAFAFVDALPKTRSGKILRRLLRARELGLPEGDLSTLEGPPPPEPAR
jgi:acetyl-CoA synthetase